MAEEETKEQETLAPDEFILPEIPADRPLDKMTVKELRAIGLQIPTLVGVHGMKKEELLAALKEVYGLVEETKVTVAEVKGLKAQIKDLRALKAEARQAEDKKKVDILRRKINRLKKKTRKTAASAA